MLYNLKTSICELVIFLNDIHIPAISPQRNLPLFTLTMSDTSAQKLGHSGHQQSHPCAENFMESDAVEDSKSRNCSFCTDDQEDDCDCESQTSESEWGDESFEELEPKVVLLCEQLWPEKVGEIRVEKISGGMNNRIVGITVGVSLPIESNKPSNDSTARGFFSFLRSAAQMLTELKRFFRRTISESDIAQPMQYVLRIPRDPDRHSVKTQAAVFRFAQGLSTRFEVPTEVHVDSNCDNVLGTPFLIQHRIPGTCLEELYGTLNHQQKMNVALHIGKIVGELSKHHHSLPGVIDPYSVSENNDGKEIRILKTEIDEDKVPSIPATRQTPLEILQSKFQEWKTLGANPDYPDEEEWLPFSKLVQIAQEQQIEHSTWSPEEKFYVNHGDLYPRNIIARIVNDHHVEITGIVDWDLLNFAPAVIAFEPPYWLWKSHQQGDDRPELSQFLPKDRYEATTFEKRQIRAVFEARAGIEVAKYANNPATVMANKIWEWAHNGIVGNEVIDLAEEVVERWETGSLAPRE